MATRSGTMSGIGKGLSSFVESYQNQQKIRQSQQAKAPDIKDVLLLSMLQKQGVVGPDVMSVVGAGAGVQAPAEFTTSAGSFTPQAQNILAGVGAGLGQAVTDPLAVNVGMEPTPQQEAQLDVQKTVAKEAAVRPEKINTERQLGLAKGDVKQALDLRQGALNSDYNMKLIVNSLGPTIETLANAYDEGGAGNWFKAGKTKLAQMGLLSEKQQEKLDDSTAYRGKVTEVILKMMPLMSQQLGKEGSTRIMQSVFERLGESLPQLQNAPANAIKMTENTIDTMFGVMNAINQLRDEIAKYDGSIDKAAEAGLVDKLTSLAAGARLNPEEQQALTALKQQVTNPLRDVISKREGWQEVSPGIRIRRKG